MPLIPFWTQGQGGGPPPSEQCHPRMQGMRVLGEGTVVQQGQRKLGVAP